jgi:RNA polymerase sigma-70 factor (ECF subfamily)
MKLLGAYTDTELVVLLNQGDKKAFEAIYKRYAADLFRYARKNISRKEDCEEILQEVFTSLWVRHESLRIIALKYYLFNSVRYKIIRFIQHNKVKRRYAEHYKLFEVMYESIDHDERTPETIQAMLIKTIADLPDRCQAAIKLRLLENLSNGEIAERMNITKKTVEVYMLKAYNHLRASYNNIYNTN